MRHGIKLGIQDHQGIRRLKWQMKMKLMRHGLKLGIQDHHGIRRLRLL